MTWFFALMLSWSVFASSEAVLVKLADDSVVGDERTRYDADLARLNAEIGEVVSKK